MKIDISLEGTPEEISRTVSALLGALPHLKGQLQRLLGDAPLPLPVEAERVYLAGLADRRKTPKQFTIRRASPVQSEILDVNASGWPLCPAVVQAGRGERHFDCKNMILYWWQGEPPDWNRYVARGKTVLWSQEENELVLDAAASATRQRELDGLFDRHTRMWNHTARPRPSGRTPSSWVRQEGQDPSNWNCMALAARGRGKVYVPTGMQRQVRRGPLTYGERWLIRWATACKIKERDVPPPAEYAEYLAVLLNRRLDLPLVRARLQANLRSKLVLTP